MTGMIKFELSKIIRRRFTKIMLAAGLILTIVIFGISFGLGTSSITDSGKKVQGIEAIQYKKQQADRKSGMLTEEKIQHILAEYVEESQYLDRDNSEKFLSELVRSSYYSKVIQPDYQFYTWLSSVYSGYGPVNDLKVLYEAAEEGASFYEAREEKMQQLITGPYYAGRHTDAETKYWIYTNSKIEEPYEYGMYGGWQSLFSGGIVWWFYILLCCICIAPIFSQERKNGVDSILLSSKYGRTRLVTAKLTAAFIFGTAVYTGYTLIALGITFSLWGTEGWQLPVQIYSAMIPYPVSMLEAFLLATGINCVILISMLILTVMLSSRTWSSFQTLVILGALMIVPQFIEFSTSSRVFNHILVLMPGQASVFANTLQQYLSYEFFGKVWNLPAMICLVYILIMLISIIAVKTGVRKMQIHKY